MYFTLQFNAYANTDEQILAPIKNLNKGLSDRNTNVIHTSFSDNFEWENSYGWTIRSKEQLVKFFDVWMFKQYPKSTSKPQVKYKISKLSESSSWVDTLQRHHLGDNVIHIRQAHLLVKESNQWKISKTRIWRLRNSDNPPTDYVKELDLFSN